MYGSRGTALLDLSASRIPPRVLPALPDGRVLAGLSWSRDGRFLTGKLLLPDESTAPGIILWSLADHSFRRLTSGGADPMFLRRGTRILFLEEGAIQLVDAESGQRRTVLSPPPHSSYLSAAAGPADRSLCTVRSTAEGDIWSLRLEPAAR
jgi:hypothetical protein